MRPSLAAVRACGGPAIIAVLALASLAPAVRSDGPPVPDIAEVRRGLAVRDSAFRNLSFVETIHDSFRRNLRHGPFVVKDQVVTALLDTSPGAVSGPIAPTLRAKIDVTDKVDPDVRYLLPEGQEWSRWQAVFPGSSMPSRRLGSVRDNSTKEQVLQGYIKNESTVGWLVPPEQLLGLCEGSPSRVLSVPTNLAWVEGAETIDGHFTARVHWEFDNSKAPPEYAWRGLIWVAPALGYAVLRREDSSRPKPGDPWKPMQRIDCKDFSLVNGLWVPSRASLVQHKYYDDGGYEMDREFTATFDSWVVNQPLRDDMFRLDFPDGTRVIDQVRGVNYTQGRINNAELERQVAAARRLAAESGRSRRKARAVPVERAPRHLAALEDEPPVSTLPVVVAGLACLCLLLGATFALIRHRRTRGASVR